MTAAAVPSAPDYRSAMSAAVRAADAAAAEYLACRRVRRAAARGRAPSESELAADLSARRLTRAALAARRGAASAPPTCARLAHALAAAAAMLAAAAADDPCGPLSALVYGAAGAAHHAALVARTEAYRASGRYEGAE